MSFPLLPTSFATYKVSLISLAAALLLTIFPRTPAQEISVLPFTLVAKVLAQDVKPRSLEPGNSIERELSGGESHLYQLTLSAGQYACVQVEQRRISLSVFVYDAEGKKTFEVNPSSIGDLLFASETATSYRLEVRPNDKSAPKGSYQIKVKEMRPATEQDKNLVAAARLIAEGSTLYGQETPESQQKAIEKAQQAIRYCQMAKEPTCEATALNFMSSVYASLDEKDKAFDCVNRALPIAQTAAAAKQSNEEEHSRGLKLLADTLGALGDLNNQFADKRKALELFNQALPIRQQISDRRGEARALNSIGMSYSYLGDNRKALEYFDKAHPIDVELGDIRATAEVLNNICVANIILGDYHKALGFCNQAYAIHHGRDRTAEAQTLDNIGNLRSNLGEYQEALDSHNRALVIHRELHNRLFEAITLNNIGSIYGTLGEYQKAIDFYNKAVEILRSLDDQYRSAIALSNIAANYVLLEDYKKALAVELELLPIRKAVNDQEGEAVTLNRIAGCYHHLGENEKATEFYVKALALLDRNGKGRYGATILLNVGDFYREVGDVQKSIFYLNEGLKHCRSIGDRNNEAKILFALARIERNRGNLTEAKHLIEDALAAVESLRINVKSYNLRASFLASVRQYHDLEIDVLMGLHKHRPGEGFDAAALRASEQGRARSLLDLLTEAGAEIQQGIDPVLIQRERVLRQTISDKADRQMRMLTGKHTPEQAAAAATEIDNLTTEYEEVQAQIRQKSPRYAALTQPVPLDLKQIQSDVVDDNTLLLEYALGEERSYVWAITPKSISSAELPKRSEIEQMARRAYEQLTARKQIVTGETPEQRRTRLLQADHEYAQTAAALSQMLLGPLAFELKNKRLVIVAEGVLQYIPFAALPEPSSSQAERKNQSLGQDVAARPPLIVEHEIITLPSASVLSVLRREIAGRTSPAKTVAVFADPVFDVNDPRFGTSGEKQSTSGEANGSENLVKRSANESGVRDFLRLRFSRQEAEQIMRLVPGAKRFEALDFSANRSAATNADLGQYSIVHFATHGLVNTQHPELSGIVLSLVDEKRQSQNGFLRLYDIYNLKLQADLVVLSACQTALGKEIKGEGLMGLSRGFMYAGATRVMASLWQIEDRASAELMRRFYEEMLARGRRPAAALQAAQISMWNDKRWRSEYYWAAFTLQGDWK